MVETRGGRRFAIFFLVAAFMVLLLGRFLKPVNDVALSIEAPFAAVITSSANGVGNTVSGLFQGPGLRSQNQQLRKDLAAVLQKNVALQQEQYENTQLRAMVHFQRLNAHLRILPASVIASEPSQISPSIIINKGVRDGLRNGMTVLDQNGYFLGAITDLASNAARVTLLTSPSLTVGVRDVKTQATGVVEGQFSGPPQLRFVVTSELLQAGDFIVTSGYYNLYPPGVLIGQVARIYHLNVAQFQTADVQSAADFSNLETVQIVRGFVPSFPNKFLPGH
jgi:rod shape-determining protein MreC